MRAIPTSPETISRLDTLTTHAVAAYAVSRRAAWARLTGSAARGMSAHAARRQCPLCARSQHTGRPGPAQPGVVDADHFSGLKPKVAR
jgi:hypothetical protein